MTSGQPQAKLPHTPIKNSRHLVAWLACPGLGHVDRGFESFTRECFDAIGRSPDLLTALMKGAGENCEREKVVTCFRRSGLIAKALSGFQGDVYARYGSYYVEQVTFALSLLTRLVRQQPEVIFLSDFTVGNLLSRWKRLTGARFNLLFSNGGPSGPPALPMFEHVHQVSRHYFDVACQAGRPAEAQTLLPYGFNIEASFSMTTAGERDRLRVRLGLPVDRRVVVSVGAINRSHKRMDVLAAEVARLPGPRPHLVMLGSVASEAAEVREAATAALGVDGYRILTVPKQDVADYYRAADVFALASITEGFGRVYVEALAQGLPCVVHDGPVQREVLGEFGFYADAARPGAFATALSAALDDDPALASRRHDWAFESFSWQKLMPQYVDMIERCAIAS